MFSETASGADEPPEGGDNFVTDPFDGIEGGNAVCRPSSPCSRNDQGKWPFVSTIPTLPVYNFRIRGIKMI